MQAEGLASQSKGPHGTLLRLGEMLRESLLGAVQKATDIRNDIAEYRSGLQSTLVRGAKPLLKDNI